MIALTKRVVAYLSEHGSLPGVTRGEIRNALELPPDKEITARVREARNCPTYGCLDIRVMRVGTEHRYWLPRREQRRAQRLVTRWTKERA